MEGNPSPFFDKVYEHGFNAYVAMYVGVGTKLIFTTASR